MIKRPTPIPCPPPEGHLYHQYVFAVDAPTWNKYGINKQYKLLTSHFGLLGVILMEIVREDDKWVVFHYVQPELI